MKRIQIQEEKFLKIREMIEKNDCGEVKVLMSPSKNTLKFEIMDKESELYIKKTLNGYIISRVAFENKRRGTMSSILKDLIKISKEEGFEKIVIESVSTEAMYSFCKKHGFEKDTFGGYIYEDEGIFGNYSIELR